MKYFYFSEDMQTGKRQPSPTMKEAKALAKQWSLDTGHPIAIVAVDDADQLYPQGAYYGRSWRGGAYHYRKSA